MSLVKIISKISFFKTGKTYEKSSDLKLGNKISEITSELESLRSINTFF